MSPETCRLHNVFHCVDCNYAWFTVDDGGNAVHVEGTGAEA